MVAALSKCSPAKTLSGSGVEQVDPTPCLVSIVKDSPALTQPPQDLAAGQQVGPYAHATLHATGAYSTVYKAYSANPPQLLALKVTSSMSKEPHNPLREARILQHAVHPSVIRLFSTSTDGNGHLILVFPFLPLDLETWIGQANQSPERLAPFALKLLHNLFSALAHIHSLGIIHPEAGVCYFFCN